MAEGLSLAVSMVGKGSMASMISGVDDNDSLYVVYRETRSITVKKLKQ